MKKVKFSHSHLSKDAARLVERREVVNVDSIRHIPVDVVIATQPPPPPPLPSPRPETPAFMHADDDQGMFSFIPGDPYEPAIQNTSKTNQDYMQQLLEKREHYIKIILHSDEDPETLKCSTCPERIGFRCLDCIGSPLFCKSCCLDVHQHEFRHHIQRWNGRFFEAAWLSDIGACIWLGHSGKPCPSVIPIDEPTPQSEDEDRTNSNPIGTPDGDIEDNVDDEDGSANLGREWKRRKDVYGRPMVVVVDQTGLHPMPVQYCQCPTQLSDEDQFLQLGFFPATPDRIRTVFTFSGLDDFLLDNQECKTKAMSYFEKLRRKTNPSFPGSTPNRYRELLRISRIWRSIQEHIIFGFGHKTVPPAAGDLVYRCPVCPQPGYNLSSSWQSDPDQLPYMAQYAIDGNFSAVHQKQKNEDVWLNDGHGFFVGQSEYQEHLKTAWVWKEKSTCHRHHAATDNVERIGCDVTGIGSVACLRNGFFIPHATVDFQKGEQFSPISLQKNIDFAVCQALGRETSLRRALLVYDIMCQWYRNFQKRVHKSPKLSLPKDIQLGYAIGDFHLHGHIRKCYPRFTLAYVEGAGVIDGEIVETLWAALNNVSKSTRGASLAHRAEIINGAMNYSNRKKITYMDKTLVKKYHRANSLLESSKQALENISKSADADILERWQQKGEEAQMQRNKDDKAMDYFGLRETTVPTMTEILTKLTKQSEGHDTGEGLPALLARGIEIEDLQSLLVTVTRQAGSTPTPAEELDILQRRQTLDRLIRKYETAIATFLDLDEWVTTNEYAPPEDDDLFEDQFDEPLGEWVQSIESFCVSIPSRLSPEALSSEQGRLAKSIEIELRKGQCDDAIEAIKYSVCRKSYLFAEFVRPAETKKHKTRAYNIVHNADVQLHLKAHRYRRARRALQKLLPNNHKYLQRYQPLLPEHLLAKRTFLDSHIRGEKHEHLPWFWHMNVAHDMSNLEGMTEFYRVNWLRAHESFKRAKEELNRVNHEMEWCVNAFNANANEWAALAQQPLSMGHVIFARGQEAIWREFASKAQARFNDAKAVYLPGPESSAP